MKRSTQLKRTGLKPGKGRPVHVRTPLQLVTVGSAPVAKMRPSRAKHTPRPKRPYVRSRKLLDAVGRLHYCTLTGHHAPVCGCHSNWEVHGKGKSIKADDNRVAAGCLHCHYELDFGTEFTEDQRKSIWWRAHVLTVQLLIERALWPAGVPVPDTAHNPFTTGDEP